MGKQSKRKNKQRRGGGSSGRPTGLADEPSSPTPETDTPSSAAAGSSNGPAAKIILKIRHGDPRVRHASLVALSRTLYDATSLENAASKRKVVQREMEIVGGNNNNKKDATAGKSLLSSASSGATEACNPKLLRALSERILDVDIPCATIAVGCLSNYISFYFGYGDGEDIQSRHGDAKKKNKKKRGSDSVRVLDEGYDDEDVVASDVMVPILLQRIQNTSATLQSMSPNDRLTGDGEKKNQKDTSCNGENNSNSINGSAEKYKLKMQEQWMLLSLALDALAGLIENCPRVVQRLSSSSNIIAQLLDVLKLTCTPSTLESTMDTAINALRALHSLLDDNLSLITSIAISTSPTVDQGSIITTTPLPLTLHYIISQLESLVAHNTLLPIMARLHACGSLLALRGVYLQQRMAGQQQLPPLTSTEQQQQHLDSAIERVQTSAEQFVLPFLYSFFEKYAIEIDMESPPTKTKTTTLFLLLQKMMSLSKQLSEMKNDESVEMQVVSQVNARAEPARMIARRQKEMKLNINVVADGSPTSIMEEEMVGEVEEKQSIVMAVDDDESITNQQQQKQQAEDGLKDELDKVVSEWKIVVGTQKLALELLANLTSGKEAEEEDEKEGEEDDDDDEGMMYAADDDEHMWDSDDEAKLLSSSAESTQRQAGGPVTTHMNIAAYEQVIYNSMMNAQHNLPIMLLRYFCYWVEFLSNAVTIVATTPTKTQGSDTGDADVKDVPKPIVRLPKLVSHDVDEILLTCALCLGNVVACNLLEGVAGVNVEKNTADIFLSQLVSLLNGSSASSTSKIAIGNVACSGEYSQSTRTEYHHQQHVTSVLLSLLQRYQLKSHLLMDTLTLDHLISILLLQWQHKSNDLAVIASDMIIPNDNDYDYDHAEATLQTHRNIISVLGVLCTNSEMPLPETIDRKVCRALLSRLALGITVCDREQVINGRYHGQQRVQQGTAMRELVDSVVIAHEVFNVLMDMYGHDDCHERVFSEECVLDQLRKSVPWFKRSIKKVVAASATSVSFHSNRWEKMKIDLVKEDECVWNETALNANRFIRYKQDMIRR